MQIRIEAQLQHTCQPKMHKIVNDIGRHILETLLPYTCVICQSSAYPNKLDLCNHCQTKLPWITNPCHHCGRQCNILTNSHCIQCLQKPPQFDQCITVFRYQSPIDDLIISFKHQQKLAHGNMLTQLLISALTSKKSLVIPDVILPVPLHPKRLRQRGFNQSKELAKPIARYFNKPLATNWIKRVEHTTSQTHLPANLRQINLQQAFKCKKLKPYQSVAIIDDVVTTGSTANTIANVLKNQGVKHVQVWAIAATDALDFC